MENIRSEIRKILVENDMEPNKPTISKDDNRINYDKSRRVDPVKLKEMQKLLMDQYMNLRKVFESVSNINVDLGIANQELGKGENIDKQMSNMLNGIQIIKQKIAEMEDLHDFIQKKL